MKMMKRLKQLSKNIRLLRNARGLSQEELADTIQLVRSTYSTYETGGKVPDLQTIDALAALYDISFDSLVNQDLSSGVLRRLYLESDDPELARLLDDYQSLSIVSKRLVMERIDTLLEREAVFYTQYMGPSKDPQISSSTEK